MVALAIGGPAFISLMIRYMQKKTIDPGKMIVEYGVYTLVITLLTQIVVTYVLGVSDVVQDAFYSFPFFIKYVIIASVIAVVLPLGQAILKKYIAVSVEVGVYDEEGK